MQWSRDDRGTGRHANQSRQPISLVYGLYAAGPIFMIALQLDCTFISHLLMLSQEKNAFQSILFSYFIIKVIDQIY